MGKDTKLNLRWLIIRGNPRELYGAELHWAKDMAQNWLDHDPDLTPEERHRIRKVWLEDEYVPVSTLGASKP